MADMKSLSKVLATTVNCCFLLVSSVFCQPVVVAKSSTVVNTKHLFHGKVTKERQELFELVIDQLINLLKEKSKENEITFTVLSGPGIYYKGSSKKGTLSLEDMRVSMKGIQYLPANSLFVTQGLDANMSCQGNGTNSQWLTYKDSDIRKPIVSPVSWDFFGYSDVNFMKNFVTLLLHESLGAVGIVDDEYQVSGVLLAYVSLSGSTDPAAVKALKQLARNIKIATREHAPTYKIDTRFNCYRWRGGMGELVSELRENTTGVGGGGNSTALKMKQELLMYALGWWEKNTKTNSQVEYQKFMNQLSEIGLEELHLKNNRRLITTFPIQMQFTTSLRTKKLTAKFLIDRVYPEDYAFHAAYHEIYSHILWIVTNDIRDLKKMKKIVGDELKSKAKQIE
ncbi:MAG: hypothetical protein M9962_07230 [Oligoflexia bacterium]|nr:hypothetical protein [Oligoflexia bacterium]